MKNYILAIMYSVILSMVSVTAIANQDPNSEDVYKSPEYIAAVAAFDSKEFHKAITLLTPFAEQGTRGAQFALTQIYGKSGDPEFANPNRAFKWHKIGALNGVMWSQYWMGHHYRILDADEAYRWYLMAANQGHTHSQLMVGALQMGSGLTQKYEPADYLHWFTLAAESGDVDAIAIVGDIYYYGDLGEPDYDKALEWYLKIASDDEVDPEVIFKIGEFHRYGYAGKINYNLTRIWYEKAANRGHDIAQFNLAELYFEGDANGGVDYIRAFKWYEKSSKQNNAEATAMLGMMYELGLGVDIDFNKALNFYQDAVNKIDSVKPDLERVKMLLRYGHTAVLKYAIEKWNSGRKKEAFNLFKHAASKGSAISALWVGHYYEYGVEVGSDLSLAENYYGQAAKGGSYEAMHRIGLLHQAYASNRLKPRKPSRTRYELSLDIQILKASGQSFTNEETFNYINYGNFSGPIIDHQGSAAEYRIATTWFMKSAKGNFPQSYKKLGEFYELGLGVKQSYYKSYLNYLLAAHYGDEESVFLAELVGDYLGEKEKSKALKLSKERIGQ